MPWPQRQRETPHLRGRPGMQRDGGRIVEVEDRDVPRALPGHDVPLRRDVRVAGPVVVDVVLKDVRDDGHVRAVAEGLELKARELEHDDVLGAEVVDLLDDGGPDVAADHDAPRSEGEDALDERRRRRLALRAGDPDDGPPEESEEERHFGQNRNPAVQRAKDGRRSRSDARDHEDEVGLRESGLVRRRAENERDLFGHVTQARDPIRELLSRLRVGDRDLGPLAHEEARETGGRPAFSEADDRHAPAAELVGGDLGIERYRHAAPASRPMKPRCVPYRPSASRPRYDHRSWPPLRVQIRDTSIDSTPRSWSCATFADQRSNTIAPSGPG